MRKHHAPALFVAACGLLGGCQSGGIGGVSVNQLVGGSTKQMTDVQPVGGFLPSPSLLQPGGDGEPALVYRNPSANFASYNRVILDPVGVWTGPDSPVAKVSPA